jgi:predicted  nucleic acid-binding Zn-ribbon protein
LDAAGGEGVVSVGKTAMRLGCPRCGSRRCKKLSSAMNVTDQPDGMRTEDAKLSGMPTASSCARV